jgi:hypothetical protein
VPPHVCQEGERSTFTSEISVFRSQVPEGERRGYTLLLDTDLNSQTLRLKTPMIPNETIEVYLYKINRLSVDRNWQLPVKSKIPSSGWGNCGLQLLSRPSVACCGSYYLFVGRVSLNAGRIHLAGRISCCWQRVLDFG